MAVYVSDVLNMLEWDVPAACTDKARRLEHIIVAVRTVCSLILMEINTCKCYSNIPEVRDDINKSYIHIYL